MKYFSVIAHVLSLALVVTVPSAAKANETRKGNSVLIGKDETIKGDIYLSGIMCGQPTNRRAICGQAKGESSVHELQTASHAMATAIA